MLKTRKLLLSGLPDKGTIVMISLLVHIVEEDIKGSELTAHMGYQLMWRTKETSEEQQWGFYLNPC